MIGFKTIRDRGSKFILQIELSLVQKTQKPITRFKRHNSLETHVYQCLVPLRMEKDPYLNMSILRTVCQPWQQLVASATVLESAGTSSARPQATMQVRVGFNLTVPYTNHCPNDDYPPLQGPGAGHRGGGAHPGRPRVHRSEVYPSWDLLSPMRRFGCTTMSSTSSAPI